MLSRLIYGGRNSLTLGLISVALAAALGVILGAVSGYYGGKVDMVIMRLLDVLQAVPAILLAIAISATLGPGYMNCILALTISQIPGFTRMTRASCLNVQGMEYVLSLIHIYPRNTGGCSADDRVFCYLCCD